MSETYRGKARRVAAAIDPARLTQAGVTAWRREMRAAVEKAADLSGEDVTPSQLKRLVREATSRELEVLEVALDGVTATTRQRVENAVSVGIRRGQSVDTIAERLVPILGPSRARVVAETEVHRTSQSIAHAVFDELGVPARRWTTRRDAAVRDAHAAMDGQVRPLDEAFEAPDGSTADYPGGFGDPALDVNCRCRIVAVRKKGRRELPPDLVIVEWRAGDAAAREWEARVTPVIRRAMASQLEDALAALRRVV